MKILITFVLPLICLCGRSQTVTYLDFLTLNNGETNKALVSSGSYLLFADANGAIHITPWTTNQWLFLTNSSSGAAGYSNVWTPLTLYGVIGVGLSGTVGSLTNGGFLNPSLTNGQNFGNAFSSHGSGTGSEQYGGSANASANYSVALGWAATATGPYSTAIGQGASASSQSATALGTASAAQATNSTALGVNSTGAAIGSTALGYAASANHQNATAVGYSATTTASNQVMLGSVGVSAVVNNYLSVLGGLTVANGATNLTHFGTNTFGAGADIAFTRYAGVNSLVNIGSGINADVPVGTNVFIDVTGPTGAFTIGGFAGSPNRSGKVLLVRNGTGFTMTIANQSGGESIAANRILTGFNADHAYTNNPAYVSFIYNDGNSRWEVCGQNGNQ